MIIYAAISRSPLACSHRAFRLEDHLTRKLGLSLSLGHFLREQLDAMGAPGAIMV